MRNEPCPCGSGRKYKKCCDAPISAVQWTPFVEDTDTLRREAHIRECINALQQLPNNPFKGSREEDIEKEVQRELRGRVFVNSLYQVAMYDDAPEVIWLSIKRRDKAPAKDWRHFQRIKNELVGAENEAIEIYPAESRLVDTANQYHLWVFKDPTFRIPMGFNNGRKTMEPEHAERTGAKQRGFEL
jgi:hypothetical protein